jgi:toxin ParE1/3/4
VRQLRYTARAAAKIDAALEYVAARSPQGAKNIRARLLTILTLLQQQPLAGRQTSKPPLRRISIAPYPYFLYYYATASEIVILRFRHAARRPLN